MQEHTNEEIKQMASGAIMPTYIKMAIPIAIALLMAGLNNLIDTLYIARGLGGQAVAAVSVILPLQLAIVAFASLITIGMASQISRLLGENALAAAKQHAGLGLKLCLALSTGFALLGLFGGKSLIHALAVPPAITELASDYATPLLLGAFSAVLMHFSEELLRAQGKMMQMMTLVLCASFTNILLNPIFIFWLDMGVRGAAVATVLAQSLSLLLAVYYYRKPELVVTVAWRDGELGIKSALKMMALGLPIFITQFGVAAQTGVINSMMAALPSAEAEVMIAAYGLLGRLFTFIILPLIAMLVAFQTLCGYNYGAGRFDRVTQSMLAALKLTTAFCALITVLIFAAPDFWLSLLTTEEALINAGVDILYQCFWAFTLSGVAILTSGYFQATGKAFKANLFSGFRIFLIQVPLMLILFKISGIEGVFLAIPLSDILAAICCAIALNYEYRQLSQETTHEDVNTQPAEA